VPAREPKKAKVKRKEESMSVKLLLLLLLGKRVHFSNGDHHLAAAY
jgi:hypothetical protein